MHPIKRGVLVVLLSLGAVGGFTHGFASLAQCHGGGCAARRDPFEEHVADVCARAAIREMDARDAEDQRAFERHQRDFGGPQWGGPQWGGPPGGPQWGGPQWGGPPSGPHWGAPHHDAPPAPSADDASPAPAAE